ncbi:PorV/PorQ family protein [candidate division KSB1 bacterium]|nr:PorV/PorQ family protein [candidate division KSB1 bacterium]
MKKYIIILTISLFMAGSGFSAESFNKAGRTALQFLKIGVGARPAALGEACIANMQDVNSVFWNPAAITGIEKREASFSYTRWFGDINITAGALGYRMGTFGVVALNYIALNYGDIQEAYSTVTGGGVDTRTGNYFSGSDLAVGLSFSREYTNKLSIGVNVKYLREELFTYTNSQWAFDVGSYYDTEWKGIRLAMSAQNFAQQARWMYTREKQQQQYELPLVFRVGWSIDLLGGEKLLFGGNPNSHRLTFNMDAIHSNDYAERVHIGAEYWFYNFIALRGGYRFNYEEGNISMGTGINYNMGSLKFKLDYAFVSYDFLDSPHRISVMIEF